tara:strand:- start:64 stop:423 length:360 start_codon:yes stop_codon:yes gene_type:complete
MVIDPLIDTIIAVALCLTAIKTIYFTCTRRRNKIPSKSVQKKKEIILKSNASVTNLKSNYFYDEELNEPTILPIQRSFECFQCKRRLSGYHKKDFFAFDREYCESCWNKIHYKIVNNRS